MIHRRIPAPQGWRSNIHSSHWSRELSKHPWTQWPLVLLTITLADSGFSCPPSLVHGSICLMTAAMVCRFTQQQNARHTDTGCTHRGHWCSATQTAMNKVLPSTSPTTGCHIRHKHSKLSTSSLTGRAPCSLMKAHHAPLSRFTNTISWVASLQAQLFCLPTTPAHSPTPHMELFRSFTCWLVQLDAPNECSHNRPLGTPCSGCTPVYNCQISPFQAECSVSATFKCFPNCPLWSSTWSWFFSFPPEGLSNFWLGVLFFFCWPPHANWKTQPTETGELQPLGSKMLLKVKPCNAIKCVSSSPR